MQQQNRRFEKARHAAMLAICAVLATTVAVGSNWFTLGYDIIGLGKDPQTVSAAEMVKTKAGEGYYLKLISKETAEGSMEEGVEACVLYINGNPTLAVADEETMHQLLTEYEEAYKGEDNTTFMQAVEWETERVEEDSILTIQKAKEILSSVGETGIPRLGVLSTMNKTWDEEVPFETVYEETDALTVGHSTVKTAGAPGVIRHYGIALLENRQELSSVETAERKLSDPVNEVVLVGTREPGTGEGTGTYIMPCSGSFSSGFGARWGRRHTGVDLAAPAGTSIIAADSGTVVKAEWNNGGYGNLVVIDHGNGVETWYAHCSELLVNAGDIVEQGELIAKVGSTGHSTGNHLHFEVRIGGNPVDPTGYLDF